MGNWQRPTSEKLKQALQLYIEHAYASTAPPPAVRQRMEAVHAAGDAPFDCPAIEHEAGDDPARFNLRLGNLFYPHMKLVIERSPEGRSHLFRADTHDRHIHPPPGSKEADAFRALMKKNLSVANAIESAWEAGGLPTFKQYLREDLARRKSAH
jgi:hypothetical protein